MLARLDFGKTTPLEVLTLHDIPEAIESIATAEIPGFQLIPGSEPAFAKIAIERAMRVQTSKITRARFVFNVVTDVVESDARDSDAHIDLGVEGVALHVNHKGNGRVYLASLGADTYTPVAGGVVIEQTEDVGQTYEGELSDGMLTVFSEGFTTPGGKKVGAALHQFVSSDGNFSRSWSRHAFAPSSV